MSIAQTKRGYFAVKYKDPESGKWRSTQLKNKEQAQKFDEEMAGRQAQLQEELTVGELAISYFKSRGIHAKTQKNVIAFLCGYADGTPGAGDFLRDKIATALTRRDLETLREHLRDRGCSNSTINKYQTYIRAILAWGAEQQLIGFNPWRDFRRLPVKSIVVQVTFEMLQKIYTVADGWLQWAIKTAFSLCLRPGIVELFSLRWDAFAWDRGVVRVAQGKSGIVKTVVAPDVYMHEAWDRYQIDRAAGVPWVCHKHGKQVAEYTSAWRWACKKAGVTMRPYDIRHLAASSMLAGGADLAAVAVWGVTQYENEATGGLRWSDRRLILD